MNCLKLQQKYGKGVMQRLKEDGTLSIKKVNKTARQALEDGIWMYDLKLQVGSMLLKELMESAKMEIEGRGEVPVFRHGKQVSERLQCRTQIVEEGFGGGGGALIRLLMETIGVGWMDGCRCCQSTRRMACT